MRRIDRQVMKCRSQSGINEVTEPFSRGRPLGIGHRQFERTTQRLKVESAKNQPALGLETATALRVAMKFKGALERVAKEQDIVSRSGKVQNMVVVSQPHRIRACRTSRSGDPVLEMRREGGVGSTSIYEDGGGMRLSQKWTEDPRSLSIG